MSNIETKSETMQLPKFHFDFAKRENQAIFEFLKADLQRLKSYALRPDQIIPPMDKCKEDAYLMAFLDHVKENSANYPWINSKMASLSVIQTMQREYRHFLDFLHFGKKTFYFSEGLTEKLCYAPLHGDCKSLKMPHGGFAFVFDSALAVEAYRSLFKGKALQEGSIITVYIRQDNLPQFGFPRLLLNIYETNGDQWINNVARQIAIKPDWTLEKAIQTDWADVENQVHDIPQPSSKPFFVQAQGKSRVTATNTDMQGFIDSSLPFLRLVLNSIVYLGLPDADIEHVQRPADEDSPEHAFSYVGQTVPGFFDLC